MQSLKSLVLLTWLTLQGCAAPTLEHPPPALPDLDAGRSCFSGLCVNPDHVVARLTDDGLRPRCLVMAWDGDGLPPTAKIALTDDSPARPGVFAAIDIPSFREGLPFPIAADPKRGAAQVYAVRVDPAVHFADHRIADSGEVTVLRAGRDRILLVKSRWGDGPFQTTQFTVQAAFNGCSL